MAYGSYQRFAPNSIWILVAANLLLFIAVLVHPQLILLLGLQPLGLLERPWTIVTNLFIHGSIWHIVANMLTLYFFGRFLSMLIGDARFLIVYFLGGIIGNLFYILLASPYSIAIGASGAVFAIGGALAVMAPKLRVYVFPIPAPLPLWAGVIGVFVFISILPHVAWQAHLGGLILGLLAGYFFRRRQRNMLLWPRGRTT
ncbi:MAG: rhomboid family intramembrane serine protease [Dehalococcoidia bacterium]|nr:MAG: rhomboid family intramembrane serine protease [Dehalococcoidia bacterium]